MVDEMGSNAERAGKETGDIPERTEPPAGGGPPADGVGGGDQPGKPGAWYDREVSGTFDDAAAPPEERELSDIFNDAARPPEKERTEGGKKGDESSTTDLGMGPGTDSPEDEETPAPAPRANRKPSGPLL